MIRIDTKTGAAALLGLAFAYMVLSLVLDRPARSAAPTDVSVGATDLGLDVWKTAAALVEDAGTTLVDVRTAEEFALYHLPGATNEPGIGGRRLVELSRQRGVVIVVAAKDEAARKLVGEARALAADGRTHYLVGGPRSWYLAFDLPVPLFADSTAPRGYEEALGTMKDFFSGRDGGNRDGAGDALRLLARLDFQPTLLKQTGRPKATAGTKKKISGGCGE